MRRPNTRWIPPAACLAALLVPAVALAQTASPLPAASAAGQTTHILTDIQNLFLGSMGGCCSAAMSSSKAAPRGWRPASGSESRTPNSKGSSGRLSSPTTTAPGQRPASGSARNASKSAVRPRPRCASVGQGRLPRHRTTGAQAPPRDLPPAGRPASNRQNARRAPPRGGRIEEGR